VSDKTWSHGFGCLSIIVFAFIIWFITIGGCSAIKSWVNERQEAEKERRG
jgi:hypothetical protein